jgi:TetR/AcrR family transcriptional regulator
VHENPRLQVRINQMLERIGASIKQCLKIAATQGALPAEHDFAAHADVLVCYAIGRWHRFVKSGFKEDPLALWPLQWAMLTM